MGVEPARHFPFTDALLRGLLSARTDGKTLRVLPTVLALNLESVDWSALREGARRRRLAAELGLLVELTSGLLGRPELADEVAALTTRGPRAMRFFPAVKSTWEEKLAQARSPDVAKRWGFWMNMSEASFRSTLEKFGPVRQRLEGDAARRRAQAALRAIQAESALNGVAEMTDQEIDAEIDAARRDRHAREANPGE